MTFTKIIDRKKDMNRTLEAKKKKQEEIVNAFRAYVLSIKDDLEKLFPYVTIGERGEDILGISYSPSTTTLSNGKSIICDSTHNIAIGIYDSKFKIGYGVNAHSNSFGIPYSLDMTKPQLKKLFKQCVETLVSKTYSVHREREWKVREEIKEYTKTHNKVFRSNLTHQHMIDNAEMFQRGGTHDYFKMNGKLFVSAYGREIYEFVERA